MFRVDVVAGSTDVSVPIFVVDSGDGTPETGYAHDTTGIDLWYRRAGGAEVSITEASLAAWNSAHADGGVEHGSDGRGRLDLPDAAVAVGVPYVEYGGTITGMVVVGGIVQLTDPINGVFTSQVIGDTGNDSTHLHVPTWTYGDDEINSYLVGVRDVSEGEWHFRVVTDWVNSTKLLTIPALPFTPANTSDLVCLLTSAAWNSAWDAEVQSEVDDALVAQKLDHLIAVADGDDPADNSIIAKLAAKGATADWSSFVNTTDSLEAVRDHVGDGTNLTEAGGTGDHLTALATAAALDTVDNFLDTEIAAIKAKTDSLTFTVAGEVNANARYIAGAQVQGAGTSGDKWRAA